ncbi:hypothetical protein NDU88_007753 [Pleurodeles waltl]|uniref:Uncharacterized protein n=1 Tax=Pleurodeles waltl TaxID=8319 RepID=A0AAV7STM7_PLEWA|nr:hypothetical protein NDU88_007753 [Pleurodeles waltl]
MGTFCGRQHSKEVRYQTARLIALLQLVPLRSPGPSASLPSRRHHLARSAATSGALFTPQIVEQLAAPQAAHLSRQLSATEALF